LSTFALGLAEAHFFAFEITQTLVHRQTRYSRQRDRSLASGRASVGDLRVFDFLDAM
jgi:hypothetical protein